MPKICIIKNENLYAGLRNVLFDYAKMSASIRMQLFQTTFSLSHFSFDLCRPVGRQCKSHISQYFAKDENSTVKKYKLIAFKKIFFFP